MTTKPSWMACVAKAGAHLGDGGFEIEPVVFDDGGRHEQLAVEVGHHEFGTVFGAINADDAEMLRADLLDTRMEGAMRLVHRQPSLAAARTGFAGFAGCSHEENLSG